MAQLFAFNVCCMAAIEGSAKAVTRVGQHSWTFSRMEFNDA
jgi:hypothetical protein